MSCTSTANKDWLQADLRLRTLAKTRALHDYEEARAIAEAARTRVPENLGFASFTEYLERIFGYGARLANEKIRVALALEQLPDLALALRDGVLNWSAVRVVSRIATAATESEWIEAAGSKSVHELEKLVSGRKRGDLPADAADPKLEEHVFLMRVLPETAALWKEAMMQVKKLSGGSLSDDEAIRTIARTVLQGPTDQGRANYQIVLTRCEDCGRSTQRGRGEEHDVAPHVLETASCDAQTIDIRGASNPQRATQTIPPATRRKVIHRDHGKCIVPGCRNAMFVDVHHLHLKSEGGDHHPDRLVTLCSAHHARVHEGRLLIEGTAIAGFIFRHADGTRYGSSTNASSANALTDAFEALLALGFKQGEAKKALDHVRSTPMITTGPEALRTALRHLHRP